MEFQHEDQSGSKSLNKPITVEGTLVSTESVAADSSSATLPAIDPGKNGAIKQPDRFPHNLPKNLGLFLCQNGQAYAEIQGTGNTHALALGNNKASNLIRQLAYNEGITLRKADIADLNHHLKAHTETAGIIKPVWYRVAQIPGGIVIDSGDARHTHIRVTPGKVEVLTEGSPTLFYRTKSTLPMMLPAEIGNLRLLQKYINLNAVSGVLFTAWLSYTLAHPKASSSKYPILVLQGNQGSGKSALCKVIMQLIDPSIVGVQLMPANPKDLAIAAQNAHVLCYDNIRDFKQSMSDALCVASTGGALTSRQLYTDTDQAVLHLHVALVLNGIHSFISEPDLAQRCLPLELRPIAETSRRSEAELAIELQADLPAIMRGLFDLIADIFTHLPAAEVTDPERMIDFVRWLAAMEKVHGAPVGTYQAVYSDAIKQGQLDSLLDNTLAAATLEYVQAHVKEAWYGTPAELLIELNKSSDIRTQRSRDWPQNPIALSKRLKSLQHALMTQGICLELSRGKKRIVTIKYSGGNHE